jgi:hypothetical protein
MKSALLSKIAMCVCPPAVVATSAVTVPPVKKAVHRLTAPSHMPAVAKPRRTFTAAYDCTPTAVPLTNASPLATDVAPADVAETPPVALAVRTPVSESSLGPTPQFQQATFPGTTVIGPTVLPTIVPPGAGSSPLPELSTWAMTISGFGAIGYAMRRKRVELAVSSIA